ncbi:MULTISPECIES: dihydrofolate reductase [unclassified Variovorax]|uniref:dihydrofolate reductase n=1 Tax=unclassified Variovorax TaxID=663243 RepID=UPI002575E25C|nr:MULTISPECIES: dihydrofolate reductase [unclassified Variovorax]MDM0087516.1 dihydrofolate reductase [Variovorax sp. J22G40]MDM0144227.1 dihydrofolate reductase [Variovorax sp. J2P1-31]
MRLNLIYASAANGVIGKDNALPWHLPEDMAHFKRMTAGCPVLMGRKTWDSLPPKFRPLPGRRNIVLTRQADWQAAGAERAADLGQAIALCADAAEVWVIGGAQIYAEAAALAQRAVVTEIAQDFEGDAHAPSLGAGWCETARETHVSSTGLPFSFVTRERSDA